MASLKMRKGINISRVVSKVAITALMLYVGGFIVNTVADLVINTSFPFNSGFKIIGWTVIDSTNGTSITNCGQNAGGGLTMYNCVSATSGSGILTVVGIIGFASVVMEFVEFRF